MTQPQQVTIFSSAWCGYCVRAKKLLEAKGISFREIDIDGDPAHRKWMMEHSKRRSVPQIFMGETHLGGWEELVALERSGELDRLLNTAA
jgi:glutaredoxin 3